MKTISVDIPIRAPEAITVGRINFPKDVIVPVPYLTKELSDAIAAKLLVIETEEFSELDPESPTYAADVVAYTNGLSGDGALESIQANPITPVVPTEVVPPPIPVIPPKRGFLPDAVVTESALKEDGTFLVAGEGIPAHFIAVGGEGDLELYLGVYRIQSPVSAIDHASWKNELPHFTVQRAYPNDRARIFFGFALKNPEGEVDVTSLYDISLKIADSVSSVTFDLVSIEAEQAYNWVAREDEEYIIIDSATNETKTTSQNVTRVDFLRTAGFLTASKVAGDYTAEFNYALADGPVKTFKVTFTVV